MSRHLLKGWFWDSSPLVLRPLRRLKTTLSGWLYRWRGRSRELPPRVVALEPKRPAVPLAHPAIAVFAVGDAERFLARQTETSVTEDGPAAFCVTLDGKLDDLPPTFLESQLLAAVAEDLEWTAAGWATPAPGPFGPAEEVRLPDGAAGSLMRLPRPEARRRPRVPGRVVPHIASGKWTEWTGWTPVEPSAVRRAGPYFVAEDVRPGTVVSRRAVSLDEALARLPSTPGPRTVLFLLPFLAVGGAERLLFDLLAGFGGRYRSLVVTLEPHRAELGQTVDLCREHTPWVYTLGDWLPRPAHRGALRHLIRRYEVETLVSWNGTVAFYEEACELRRLFPRLRLVNQLFNHEGGWIEHYGPRFAASVDLHIAVNRPIGRALKDERGVAAEQIAVIQHAVSVPPEVPEAERLERRDRVRRDLGLPADAVVVGSFVRLHDQKRPFDVLRLARRLEGRGIHFLLAGGGPLEAAIVRELEERPLASFTRLPFQHDVDRLFDAVDLCLMTSAFEGLPVFLLEGLARGIPCVTTAVGDVPYLLEDGGGVAVERVGDLDGLEAAILALTDDERRADEGQRGRATVVARFSLERYVRDYEEALFPNRRRS